MVTAPKVFLSHASEDKDRFVIPFATSLRAKGIDVWLDKWEILPGDSLVDKLFEEGLKEAEAVLIVVSAFSVVKPWVREELNAAIVGRIKRQTKVIPIVLDKVAVPEALSSLVWESVSDLKNYSAVLDRVIAAIMGRRNRPMLGALPDYATEIPIPGLQSSDMRVLNVIYKDAIERNHPVWSPEELSLSLGSLSLESQLDSLEILDELGYIRITRVIDGARGIGILQPTLSGFMVFARTNLPDFDRMARIVAMTILNEKIESASKISEITAVPQFIVDSLLDYFESRGWVKVSATIGDKYIYSVSPSMRRAFV